MKLTAEAFAWLFDKHTGHLPAIDSWRGCLWIGISGAARKGIQMSAAKPSSPNPQEAARRLALPAIGAGLLGGLFMIVLMILVMGAEGMGYANPLNLGMASFVYTVAPPKSMLPSLMPMMGVKLPATAMPKASAMLHAKNVSPAMMQQFGAMLTSMHVPPPMVKDIGQLMTGTASNSTVVDVMNMVPASARATVMRQMPVEAGQVVVGTVLHFAFSAFLGIVFFAIIGAAAWFKLPELRTPAGMITAGVIGGILVWIVMNFGILPVTNPMMSLVPQVGFFFAHVLFGLVVGMALAMAFRRCAVAELLPS